MNTPVPTPFSLEKVIDLRRRIVAGEEVSEEEIREAVAWLRQDRMSVIQSPKARSKSTPVNLEELFQMSVPGSSPNS